jgi:uncharacterized protein (TIGR00251 family)
MSAEPWYKWNGADLRLQVHVQPRPGRDGVSGLHGGRVRIRIGAVPQEGRANRRLIDWLAGEFRVAPAAVTLLKGRRGRDKTVLIARPPALPAWFTELASPG